MAASSQKVTAAKIAARLAMSYTLPDYAKLIDTMHLPIGCPAEYFDIFNEWISSDHFILDAMALLVDPSLDRLSIIITTQMSRLTGQLCQGDPALWHAALERLFHLAQTATDSGLVSVLRAYAVVCFPLGPAPLAAHLEILLRDIPTNTNGRSLRIFTEFVILFELFDETTQYSLYEALASAIRPHLLREVTDPAFVRVSIPILRILFDRFNVPAPPSEWFLLEALALLSRLTPAIPGSPELACAAVEFMRRHCHIALQECLLAAFETFKRFRRSEYVCESCVSFFGAESDAAIALFGANLTVWVRALASLARLTLDVRQLFGTDPVRFFSIAYGGDSPAIALLEGTASIFPGTSAALAARFLTTSPLPEHAVRCVAAVCRRSFDPALAESAIARIDSDILSRLAHVHLLSVITPHVPDSALAGVLDSALSLLSESSRCPNGVCVPRFSASCTALRALADRAIPPPADALSYISANASYCVSFDALALLDLFWDPSFATSVVAGALDELGGDPVGEGALQLLRIIDRHQTDIADVNAVAEALCKREFGDSADQYFAFLASVAPAAAEAAVDAWLRMDGPENYGLDIARVVTAAVARGADAQRRRSLAVKLLSARGPFEETVDLCAWATAIARLLQTLEPDPELGQAAQWIAAALAEARNPCAAALAIELRLSVIVAGWPIERDEFEDAVRSGGALRSNYHRKLLACALRAGVQRWPETAAALEALLETALKGADGNAECEVFDSLPAPLDTVELPGFVWSPIRED
jgi:hypothetical protein